MLIEIAHYLASLTLASCFIQFLVGFICIYYPHFFKLQSNGGQINLSFFRSFLIKQSYLQFFFLSLSFVLVIICFLNDDFSVALVANHSQIQLPNFYKIAATWGNHEGSILLWSLILSFYSFLVARFSQSLKDSYLIVILAVIALVSIWLISYMLFLSSPFSRLFPVAVQGNELNPLLQDIGLIFHPPILYLGYVGLVVPFASAICALINTKLDQDFLLWMRPFSLLSWLFLTAGVLLGSFWAYYELGWGGYWFWDPVENSSLMPWLINTALIHSLAVSQKRNSLKNWSIILALVGFNLSLLGTFLVRSGVITSVHAFASDPNKGIFILLFLLFFSLVSLLIYLAYFSKINHSDRHLTWLGREMMMNVANILFMALFTAVFLGTLYPLFLQALNLAPISIGEPYYNQVMIPLMIPVILLMAIAPWQNWNEEKLTSLTRPIMRNCFIIALIFALIIHFIYYNNALSLTIFLASFAFLLMFIRFFYASFVVFVSTGIFSYKWQSFTAIAMQMAHIGITIFIIGAVCTSQFSKQGEKILTKKESFNLADYQFELIEVNYQFAANYGTYKAKFAIKKQGQLIAHLYPEKREYLSGVQTSESSIYSDIFKDLTISFASANDDRYAFRFYYKPMIRLLWFGVVLMILAAIIGIADRRYRYQQKINV